MCCLFVIEKTAYEMRISDWGSDVCSSDLRRPAPARAARPRSRRRAANSGGGGGAGTCECQVRSWCSWPPQASNRNVADVVRRRVLSSGSGQPQRAERVQRVRRRGGGAVGRKGHGAVTETLERLSQALPAAFAAAAHVGEVDLERDHLAPAAGLRSEEHTSELQSLMRISYAVFCLKKKKNNRPMHNTK